MMKKILTKYLEKQTIKNFFINFGVMFIGVLGLYTLLTFMFTESLPNNYLSWVILIGILSIYYAIGEVRTSKRFESTDQLTRDNYWKLKNELKKKVNRRQRH